MPDNYIGYLSTSMFAGMMFGAVGWGSCKFYVKMHYGTGT